MKRMPYRIGLWLLFVVPVAQAAEAQSFSANEIVPFCQLFLTGQTRENLGGAGQCLGSMQTIVALGLELPPPYRFCMPETATVQQAMRIVVNSALSHPENMHLNFVGVATRALASVWPCR
jgi:hypothetical protein